MTTELDRKKSVNIFGLGYVGCVSTACFARIGHRFVGLDANPDEMDMLRRGSSPIVEDRIW